MLSSLYIGATGMKSLSEGLSVTSNNLANCSTVGFKSQMALYSDLISQNQANPGEWNYNQENSHVAVGQVGMGVRVDEIATNFTQGGFESTNNATDLAINGKGYFVVQDTYGDTFYTRAGDFTLDSEGVMRTPAGLALTGINLSQTVSQFKGHDYSPKEEEIAQETETETENTNTNTNQATHWSQSDLQPVTIDAFQTLEHKTTSALAITNANFNSSASCLINETNPYFSLLSNYDATAEVPLSENNYSYSQAMSLYDVEGNAHEVVLYYDGRPQNGAQSAVEFLVAETDSNAENTGSGCLMSGILQFNEKGQLSGLAAYTPTEAGNTDLSTWTQANLSEDGLPQFSINDSFVSLDFGIRSKNKQWSTNNAASDVGRDLANAALLGESETANDAATAYTNESFMANYDQNGYASAVLSSYKINTDGIVYGNFSNGEHVELWQIPLARFTSEDGLRRSGDNLFVAPKEAGAVELGNPTSENYGAVISQNIEQSNVDLSREMVTMIVTQRGFQSNSKVVTTSDEILKTAINLKR